MKLFDLTGRVAIVTGSTQGIGRGIAENLAAAGAPVVVTSRSQEDCDRVAAEINARHADASGYGAPCDVAHADSIRARHPGHPETRPRARPTVKDS